MKQTMVKKYIQRILMFSLVAFLIFLFVVWNRYLNKYSLLTRYVTSKEQDVYILGTFHTYHFNKLLNYSMEDMLSVIENVEPDVVFIEAREEYFQQYGVVDGPIDMSVAYSYCLDNNIQVEMIDWWVVDNNYQSGTTSDVRDDNIFNNIKIKLQNLEKNKKVLVICGAGHFYEQQNRFEEEGFIKKRVLSKKSYFISDNKFFSYPTNLINTWEKRAYFYSYTYPDIINMDDNLNENIKKQFTSGNHDAFYKQQLEYCDLFKDNTLFE